MKILLSNIDPNPHRNMKRNPINREQVSALVESMKRNSVWANIVVRKHPDVAGRYQLAYGHHRLEAMKKMKLTEGNFIVTKVDDWGMYTAMVDENESQQKVTPELIFENIESGINYLDPLVKKCETLEEFTKVVPRGTTLDKSGYTQVRSNLLSGQGLGRGFLAKVLPGDKSTRPANIQLVCDSHYEKTKATAKDAEAAAKEAEAKEKQQEADLAKTREEKEKAQAIADRLNKEAANLKEAATKLRDSGVAQGILLSFPTVKHMTEFARSVKREGIPKTRHAGLAKMLLDRGSSARQYESEIGGWWFVASGRSKKAQAEAKRQAFKKKHRSKTIDEFVAEMMPRAASLIKEIISVTEYAGAIENPRSRASLENLMLDLELRANALGGALQDDNDALPPNVTALPGSK